MIGALFDDRRRRGWLASGCRAHRRALAIAVLCALAAIPAAAAEFAVAPGQKIVGDLQRYVVKKGDVFPDIARRFDLGYTALAAANPGVDPWVPGAGQSVTIPSVYVLPDAPHQGIVINLGQYRLFYFPPGGNRVLTYPIGLGVIGWKTPLGATRVARKQPKPVWYPPPSIRAQHPDLPAIVPAGPDNPLGAFALYLGWPKFLIHGTNKPDGVGRNVSHGCIHLYPEDIAELFRLVPAGTPVHVVNQPATAGWGDNRLYVEIHPSQSQTEEIDTERPVTGDPAQGVRQLVRAAAGEYADAVDWDAVERAAGGRTGMPIRVADRSAYAGEPATAYSRAAAQPDTGSDAAQSDDEGSAASDESGSQERFDRLLDSLTRADQPDDRQAAQPNDSETDEPYVRAPQDPYDRTAEDPFRRDADR